MNSVVLAPLVGHEPCNVLEVVRKSVGLTNQFVLATLVGELKVVGVSVVEALVVFAAAVWARWFTFSGKNVQKKIDL